MLFLTIEAEWREADGSRLLPATFSLVTTFPRRSFTRLQAHKVTLEQAGLGGAQEALLVEIPNVNESQDDTMRQ